VKVTPKFWNRCANDRRYFWKHCCRVRTQLLDGSYSDVPFIPNAEQETVLAWMDEQESLKQPIRFIILKARQLGMTTLACFLWFHLAVFRKLTRCQIIGHRLPDTKKIAAIPHLINNMLAEEHQAKCQGKKKGIGLHWENGSWLELSTQGGESGGRGDAPTAVHATELAFWDKYRVSTDAEEVLQAYFSPVNIMPGTYLGCESTADVAAGSMYERFVDSHCGAPGLWKSFFFSWTGVPKYTLKYTPAQALLSDQIKDFHRRGYRLKAIEAANRLGYNEVWYERSIEHNLSPGEVFWAMAKVRDMKGDVKRFDQEFPLTWEEAFVSGGRPVFDQSVIAKWQREELPEETVFGCRFEESGELDSFGKDWSIFRQPQPHHEYIMGADSCAGVSEGDYGCLVVFDRHTREFVAQYYAKVPPDVLGDQAVRAATFFNKAYLIPEINNHGYAMVRRVLDLGYSCHRRHPGREMRPGQTWSDIYGWLTKTANRQMLFDLLAEEVREEAIDIYSKDMLSEMRTFIYNAYDKPIHMSNRHDDAIMSGALCIFADMSLRPPIPLEESEEKKTAHPESTSRLDEWRQSRRDFRRGGKKFVHPRLGKFF
jgi:hypothetical protein